MGNKLDKKQHQPMPWDRLKNETKGDFELFLAYKDLEVKDLDRLSEETQLSTSILEHIKEVNRWDERIVEGEIVEVEKQMPQVEQELSSDQELTELDLMRKKHMKFSENLLSVANKLNMILDKYAREALLAAEKGEIPPKKPAYGPDQITKLADKGIQIQRLTLGEASQITESKESYDMSEMSDEELANFQKLIEKANKGK